MMAHGHRSTYTSATCRCDLCREANTLYTRERRAERHRLTAQGKIPETVVHSLSTYNNWGCRCEVCSEAKSQANKRWKQDHPYKGGK